jgi:hypothetical protein
LPQEKEAELWERWCCELFRMLFEECGHHELKSSKPVWLEWDQDSSNLETHGDSQTLILCTCLGGLQRGVRQA